ncbi:hypothetical protein B0H14DRAFT_3422375 [Mycena olivaceomarginata]|nr:hypothetical protein B0H14DRAFT_3422375 [Mycena olivaceomarginata]
MTSTDMIPELDNARTIPDSGAFHHVRRVERSWNGKLPNVSCDAREECGCLAQLTVVKAMVSRYPSGAQRGHHTMQGCIAEWQQHCASVSTLTPRNPNAQQLRSDQFQAPSGIATCRGTGPPDGPFCMPNLQGLALAEPSHQKGDTRSASPESTSVSSTSSISTTWEEVPETARLFALWCGRVVFSDRGEAKEAFLKAEARGGKPRVLSTANYDEAQAFSEGIYWVDDD